MALVLGIETSCDETAAAVVDDGRRILSNVVASQAAIHSPYGGVVPELASRHHVEAIVPVLEAAIGEAGIELRRAGRGRGHTGAGARRLAAGGAPGGQGDRLVHEKPLVPVHHMAGHVQAAMLAHGEIPLPALALVVSGGPHESLPGPRAGCLPPARPHAATTPRARRSTRWRSFWVSAIPGGPVIDRLAQGADPRAVEFKIARIKDGSADFSFSGIKTAVLLHVRRQGIQAVPATSEVPREVRDLLASFQAAVVAALVRGLVRMAKADRPRSLILSGGVAANSLLRSETEHAARELGLPVFIPPLDLTTDNAAMIAAAGFVAYRKGVRGDLATNADPHLRLG